MSASVIIARSTVAVCNKATVQHTSIIHARCPIQPTWDYYTVVIEPLGFLDVHKLELVLDSVRGVEETQEQIAEQLGNLLPGCKVTLIGRHTANTNTVVTVEPTHG